MKITCANPDADVDLDRTAEIIVEIAPKALERISDEPVWSPADTDDRTDVSHISLPWKVPALKLVQPTPPTSRGSTPLTGPIEGEVGNADQEQLQHFTDDAPTSRGSTPLTGPIEGEVENADQEQLQHFTDDAPTSRGSTPLTGPIEGEVRNADQEQLQHFTDDAPTRGQADVSDVPVSPISPSPMSREAQMESMIEHTTASQAAELGDIGGSNIDEGIASKRKKKSMHKGKSVQIAPEDPELMKKPQSKFLEQTGATSPDTPASAGSVDLLDAQGQKAYEIEYARELDRLLQEDDVPDSIISGQKVDKTSPADSFHELTDPLPHDRGEKLVGTSPLEDIAEEPQLRPEPIPELGVHEPASFMPFKKSKKEERAKKKEKPIIWEDDTATPELSQQPDISAEDTEVADQPLDLEEHIEPEYVGDKEIPSTSTGSPSLRRASTEGNDKTADYFATQPAQRAEMDIGGYMKGEQNPSPSNGPSVSHEAEQSAKALDRDASSPEQSQEVGWDPLPAKKAKKNKKPKRQIHFEEPTTFSTEAIVPREAEPVAELSDNNDDVNDAKRAGQEVGWDTVPREAGTTATFLENDNVSNADQPFQEVNWDTFPVKKGKKAKKSKKQTVESTLSNEPSVPQEAETTAKILEIGDVSNAEQPSQEVNWDTFPVKEGKKAKEPQKQTVEESTLSDELSVLQEPEKTTKVLETGDASNAEQPSQEVNWNTFPVKKGKKAKKSQKQTIEESTLSNEPSVPQHAQPEAKHRNNGEANNAEPLQEVSWDTFPVKKGKKAKKSQKQTIEDSTFPNEPSVPQQAQLEAKHRDHSEANDADPLQEVNWDSFPVKKGKKAKKSQKQTVEDSTLSNEPSVPQQAEPEAKPRDDNEASNAEPLREASKASLPIEKGKKGKKSKTQKNFEEPMAPVSMSHSGETAFNMRTIGAEDSNQLPTASQEPPSQEGENHDTDAIALGAASGAAIVADDGLSRMQSKKDKKDKKRKKSTMLCDDWPSSSGPMEASQQPFVEPNASVEEQPVFGTGKKPDAESSVEEQPMFDTGKRPDAESSVEEQPILKEPDAESSVEEQPMFDAEKKLDAKSSVEEQPMLKEPDAESSIEGQLAFNNGKKPDAENSIKEQPMFETEKKLDAKSSVEEQPMLKEPDAESSIEGQPTCNIGQKPDAKSSVEEQPMFNTLTKPDAESAVEEQPIFDTGKRSDAESSPFHEYQESHSTQPVEIHSQDRDSAVHLAESPTTFQPELVHRVARDSGYPDSESFWLPQQEHETQQGSPEREVIEAYSVDPRREDTVTEEDLVGIYQDQSYGKGAFDGEAPIDLQLPPPPAKVISDEPPGTEAPSVDPEREDTVTEEDVVETYQNRSYGNDAFDGEAPMELHSPSPPPAETSDEPAGTNLDRQPSEPKSKPRGRHAREASGDAYDSDDSADSGFDVQKRRRRLQTLAEDLREPSPVSSTTKNRSSGLFDSSPWAKDAPAERPSRETMTQERPTSHKSGSPETAKETRNTSGPSWSFGNVASDAREERESLFGGPFPEDDSATRSSGSHARITRGRQPMRSISERSGE